MSISNCFLVLSVIIIHFGCKPSEVAFTYKSCAKLKVETAIIPLSWDNSCLVWSPANYKGTPIGLNLIVLDTMNLDTVIANPIESIIKESIVLDPALYNIILKPYGIYAERSAQGYMVALYDGPRSLFVNEIANGSIFSPSKFSKKREVYFINLERNRIECLFVSDLVVEPFRNDEYAVQFFERHVLGR